MIDWVYVAEAETGQIKIGLSASPYQRVAAMSGGSPVPIRLVAMWRGHYADERRVHKALADSRSHGEWFFRTPEVEAFFGEKFGRGLERVYDWDELRFRATDGRVDNAKKHWPSLRKLTASDFNRSQEAA